MRNLGDYDIGPGESESHSLEQISRAEQFIQLAERTAGQRAVECFYRATFGGVRIDSTELREIAQLLE